MDPDRVEEKNLNRILHATMDDARHNRLKVDVIAQAIAQMGLDTDVIPLGRHLGEPAVVRAVADCDVLFAGARHAPPPDPAGHSGLLRRQRLSCGSYTV